MALVVADRVKQTAASISGTGTYTLSGTFTGFQTFTDGVGDGNTTYYAAVQDANFEIGIGTYTASGATLARTTILQSSNSDNAVSWSSATPTIFTTYPADKAVFKDASGNINGTFVGNITGNVTGNTSGTAATVTGAAQTNITSVGTLSSLTTSGDITVGDDLTVNGGLIDLKTNSGSVAQLKFYCESGNAHAQTLQAQPHSASASDVLTLPTGGNSTLVSRISTDTLTNKTLTSPVLNTGVSGTAIKDEDDMTSDSATHLATQQSIKAYVDAQKADMQFVLEDGDGTEVQITKDKEVKFVEGGGLDINWTDTSTGSDGDPYDLTFTVNATQTGITSILNNSLVVGRDADNDIDFATDNNIIFRANGADQIKLTDGALVPVTDNDIDLGTSSLEFKDLYIDGTAYLDTANITTINSSPKLLNTYLWMGADGQVMYWGANFEVTLTHIHNVGLRLNTDKTLSFRDSAINIGSPADGDLDINADDEIELNSTLIDINGNLDVSGSLTLGGTAITSTASELNILDGVTATASELNIMDGVTSTTAELNILDGVTASAADINLIDGITNGTVIASKAIITDSNKDISGGRNITISGELDAATLDISGNADIDGTLEADAITVNGTALNTVIADEATALAIALG